MFNESGSNVPVDQRRVDDRSGSTKGRQQPRKNTQEIVHFPGLGHISRRISHLDARVAHSEPEGVKGNVILVEHELVLLGFFLVHDLEFLDQIFLLFGASIFEEFFFLEKFFADFGMKSRGLS